MNLQFLLGRYWECKRLVPRSRRYYDRPFKMGQGVTQGDPVPPTIFNIVVNAVVRATLWEVYGPWEALHGLGWPAGNQKIVTYVDDDHVAGRNPIWMQGILTTLVQMFECLVLYTNLGKINSMTYTPDSFGYIWERTPTSRRQWKGCHLLGAEADESKL